MSAQPASNTILAYGPQGAQQLASSAVLSYTPAGGPRRVSASFAGRWAESEATQVQVRAPMERTTAVEAARRAPWARGGTRQQSARSGWGVATSSDAALASWWHAFLKRLQPMAVGRWGVASSEDRAARAPWGQYLGRPAVAALAPWVLAVPRDASAKAPWGRYTRRPLHIARQPWGTARRADAERWLPWVRFGRTLNPGWGVVTPPGGPITDDNGTVLVPVRTVYQMTNEATLTRVSTGAALPVLSMTYSTDRDSWAWRVDVSLPYESMAAVMPAGDGLPVLLRASINGYAVDFVAESIAAESVFAKRRIRVSGRSQSALLSDPYAVAYSYSSASAITAQQAAINAVTEAGLPLGWSIGWHIDDWLLPAGLWQHQGTPLSAVQRIAAAAGAYVQTDPLLKVLHVRHAYPAAPWDWAGLTPAVVLPTASVLREGVEWMDKPAYNEVYVSGQSVGVLGHVVKVGTTGGLAAGTVVDDLITATEAARQRGRAVLGDTGRQQRVTLSMPITDEIPLLQVGQLIDVTDGGTARRGLVRSVSATYVAPSARQTVEVEAHG